MPIKLVTGTPGAGKTLTALQDALTQVGVDFSGDGDPLAEWDRGTVPTRPVFFCNVRGLDQRLPTIESPWDWEQCPDGSLIVVDEAWEFFGKQLRNSDDPRILNLAKHRHRGFDFIWTTQAPGQLTPFVRDLVGAHVHVTRKFGTQTTVRYEWPHVQDSPNGPTAKGQAIEQIWRYPPKVFRLYESATLHTVKRKIPTKIILALGMAVLVPILLVGGFLGLYYGFQPSEAIAATPAAATDAEARSEASTEARGGDGEGPMTIEEYVFQRTPRIEIDPASAPIYDRFEVQDYPRMFCVISGDQRVERISCRCRTQQMTPILVDDRVCITVARHGYWDPRLRPVGYSPRERDDDSMAMPARPSSDVSADSSQPIGARGFDRSIKLPYVPPDATR
jgi:zona occludens toxin